MEKEVLVYVDLQGTPHLVGRLWARMRKDRETATFEYDKTWLAHPERFSLEPALVGSPALGASHQYAPPSIRRGIADGAEKRFVGWRVIGARPELQGPYQWEAQS